MTNSMTIDRLANCPRIHQLVNSKPTTPIQQRAELSFAQAVQLLVSGAKICRLDWPNSIHFIALIDGGSGRLRVTWQSGRSADYELIPADAQATDWYLVEDD